MIDGHKLIVVTPYGRRRYAEVLACYVLAEPAVDEWHLWFNTDDPWDIEWAQGLRNANRRVVLVAVSTPLISPCQYRICQFYPFATDPTTVYVRMDDDVVYAAPGAIAGLAAQRITDPKPFLLFGNVLNTALTSHFHQRAKRATERYGTVGYNCMDPVGWNSPRFAVDLHRRFLGKPDRRRWELPDWDLTQYEHHSVNVIAWLGRDAQNWGPVGASEEVWLSCDKPRLEGRPNRVGGRHFFAHYAFFPQREAVDARVDILQRYRKLAGLP